MNVRRRKLSKENDLLKKHSFLWNVCSQDFKNATKKDQTRKELLEFLVGRDITHLKKRLRSLREGFDTKGIEDDVNFAKNNTWDITLFNDISNEKKTIKNVTAAVDKTMDLVRHKCKTKNMNSMQAQSLLPVLNKNIKMLEKLIKKFDERYSKKVGDKTPNQQYFDLFTTQMSSLPKELKLQCDREFQQILLHMMCDYQDLADEARLMRGKL